MKKSILVLSVVLLQAFNCYSQDQGYAAMSLGTSIPIGAFGSKNLNNSAAGFATAGLIMDLSGGVKLNKNFGLCGILRLNGNSTDVESLTNEFHNADPSTSFIVESDGWFYGAAMIGGYGSFPLGKKKKISFEPKAMIGNISVDSPKMTLIMTQESSTVVVIQESADTNAFAFLIGAGFRFDIGRKICLLTNIDYLGSKPKFEDVKITDTTGGKSTTSFSQNIGTLNCTVGIGLRF